MTETMNLNVRISGSLREHVAREVSEGDYESASEFVRDLLRKQKHDKEEEAFRRLKAKLQEAAAAPRSRYSKSSADEIRERVAHRLKE